jgi:hypothetical protein
LKTFLVLSSFNIGSPCQGLVGSVLPSQSHRTRTTRP